MMRSLWPDRNPPRRAADRVEAAAIDHPSAVRADQAVAARGASPVGAPGEQLVDDVVADAKRAARPARPNR